MQAWDKKLISLRLPQNLLTEFDGIRHFTNLHNRTSALEHAMRLYIIYVQHQVQHREDFE